VQRFVCRNDGDCSVTYKYRRLAKCFPVGMKKSLILSVEEREARKKLVKTNRLEREKEPKGQCMKLVCIIYIIENCQITLSYLKKEKMKRC